MRRLDWPPAGLDPDEIRHSRVARVQRPRRLRFGLRSLAPGDADFKSRYYGDLRNRDAAYHQGTVWGWLVGPFVDAWLKVHPDDVKTVSAALRGCIAQAWSVAELLRVMAKTPSS